MTQQRYGIYYESRELGDPMLGTVEASSTKEALRRAMPCAGLWAVRLQGEEGRGKAPQH